MHTLPTHIRRTEFKIDGDTGWEEMKRLIQEHTGQSVDELTKEKFDQQIQSLNQEKSEILAFMGKRWTELKNEPNKENKRKADELLSICRILYKSGLIKEYTVDQIRESPDFIIAHTNGKKVGIELTQLVDYKLQEKRGDLKKALSRALRIVTKNNPEITGTFNLTINTQAIFFGDKYFSQLNRNDKILLARQIADYIVAYYSGTPVLAPPYISNITHSKDAPLAIELAENYILRTSDRKLILDAVIEKENQLDNYRNNTRLNKYWLILIVAGSGEAGSFDIDKVSIQFTSTFDKVLLAEIFSGKLKVLIG